MPPFQSARLDAGYPLAPTANDRVGNFIGVRQAIPSLAPAAALILDAASLQASRTSSACTAAKTETAYVRSPPVSVGK